MMDGFLYKDTEVLRATVKRTAYVILGPDPHAPAGSWREVQMVLPDEPRVYVSTTKTPEEMGLDRDYLMAPWYPQRNITIRLLPHQWLSAMSESVIAECSLIVEHYMPRGAHASKPAQE